MIKLCFGIVESQNVFCGSNVRKIIVPFDAYFNVSNTFIA